MSDRPTDALAFPFPAAMLDPRSLPFSDLSPQAAIAAALAAAQSTVITPSQPPPLHLPPVPPLVQVAPMCMAAPTSMAAATALPPPPALLAQAELHAPLIKPPQRPPQGALERAQAASGSGEGRGIATTGSPVAGGDGGVAAAGVRKKAAARRKKARSGPATFVCALVGCGKAFRMHGDLQTHMRKHTGDEPFKCSFPDCDMRYKWRSSLSHHEGLHRKAKDFRLKPRRRRKKRGVTAPTATSSGVVVAERKTGPMEHGS